MLVSIYGSTMAYMGWIQNVLQYIAHVQDNDGTMCAALMFLNTFWTTTDVFGIEL